MNRKIACLVLLTVFLTQLSVSVYAQDASDWLGTILNIFGIPQEWQKMPELMYYFIVPFIGIWAILLSFLRVIPIFRYSPRLEMVITFVIAFSTVWPTGWLMIAVKAMFTLIGFLSVFAFGGLFIFGIIIYSIITGKRFWGTGWGKGGTLRDMRSIDQKIGSAERKLANLNDRAAKGKITATELNQKAGPIKAELKKLKDIKAEIVR